MLLHNTEITGLSQYCIDKVNRPGQYLCNSYILSHAVLVSFYAVQTGSQLL